ncbi:MAG: HAMP domain-containing protein [Gammaproteobacteria bacterium]|nr:HAMP domain-containing protein [Gammaproteobacteria bacterium]
MASDSLKRFTTSSLPVLGLLALVLTSLHLMSSAVQNTEELSRLFIPLLIASALGLMALLVVVGVNVVQLVIRYRQQAAGSRLTLRLLIFFLVLSLAPVSVVYFYSQQFMQQGIESWFDVEIDRAMKDVLELSRASLDLHRRVQLKTTQRLLTELTGSSVAGMGVSLEELRERYGLNELTLFSPTGKTVSMSHVDPTVLIPSIPDKSILQQVLAGESFVGLIPLGEDGGLVVRVMIGDPERGLLLQAIYPTSINFTNLTDKVQAAYNRYKELSFLRQSLKNTFTLTLAMVLLFGLLSAIWAAFYAARQLVAPVADIAEGTRAVAKGEYDKQLPLPKAKDELGFLVASFNIMTRRIAQSRDEADRGQHQVEAQRAYLEAVLGRLSSGVMALDGTGYIRTANQAADDILGLHMAPLEGLSLEDIQAHSPHLEVFVEAVEEAMAVSRRDWRTQIVLFGAEGRQVLLCRGTPLQPLGSESAGYVLVFDDVTAVINAQRDAAWGEVARRLAHEIKNPLTPIQLSAERVRHKCLDSLAGKEADVLDRATQTIVSQVEAMKRMVDDFSDYARPPQVDLKPVTIDSLIGDVAGLYRSAGADHAVNLILESKDAGIQGDPVRLRQVVHNLIKNAQEAVEGTAHPEVQINTGLSREDDSNYLQIRVCDNGPGFDDEIMEHLFEPYVTTKIRGTGLGLAVVKKIVEEHGGIVWAENRPEGGACVILRLPVNRENESYFNSGSNTV